MLKFKVFDCRLWYIGEFEHSSFSFETLGEACEFTLGFSSGEILKTFLKFK